MKIVITKIALALYFVSLLVLPAIAVYGQTPALGIANPLKAQNIQCLVADFLQLVVNIGAFVCVGYIIWAGFLFVSAGGDKGQVEHARNTFYNALIGTALIMGAWVFAQIIANTINQVSSSSVQIVNSSQC